MKRTRLRIVGQSGSGLLTVGELVSKGLQQLGFHLVADREYPSLIKGGHSCYTINFADHPVRSLSHTADILVAIDKHSLVAYFDTLKEGGIFVHGYERTAGIADILKKADERNIEIVHLMSRQVAHENGGNELMANVILTGMAWKVLGFDYKIIHELLAKKFAKKEKILDIGLRCLKAGYDGVETHCNASLPEKKERRMLLDGNHAVALGAVHGGCRFYVAYPMSPSSSILHHMAAMSEQTGVLVKQAEDEITVAQMAIGAMFAGTRALCATSGGGFDLMTESLSLTGIIECPWVVVLCQRPGPGTGLPTWTNQGDLNLAIHSAHGEFPRVVVSVADPTECFEAVQHAFNLAEEFQVPVIVLSEKLVCESKLTVPVFDQNAIPIKRGLVQGQDLEHLNNADRYRVTESGLSKRWIPGSSDAYYFANGDEHWEDGTLTEEAHEAGEMYAKRCRKMELLEEIVPEPMIYSANDELRMTNDDSNSKSEIRNSKSQAQNQSEISFIGWGSSKNVMLDVIAIMAEKGVKVNYLHYQYVWPLKAEAAKAFFANNKNVHLVESNHDGQFGAKVEGATGEQFAGKLLKWDGRPFFVEDVVEYINNNF